MLTGMVDQVGGAEALVGRQHAPERGVQHHQRRRRGQHAHRGDRLRLQRRRHVQHALDQQRHAEPEGDRHHQAEAGEAGERRADQAGGFLAAALADTLRQGAGERLADAEIEDPEDADQRQRQGEQAPALQAELVHEERA